MDKIVSDKVGDFFEQYPVRRYVKGEVLIQAHEEPAYIYHLIDGRVKQYDIAYRGEEVVLNTFKPPAFFPMSSAINATPNVYFYEAETDVELHLAPVTETLEFIKGSPDVLYNLLARVYRGTDGLLGRLAHLMAGNARSRILYELLIQMRRFGKTGPAGTIIPANETDIAAQTGLARETVNREIQKLKREGIISVTKGSVVIRDADRLTVLISREL